MTKSALIVHSDYNLCKKNNTAFCSSRQIAQEFSKLHKNVLADVRNLNCSDEFRQLNFQLIRQSVDLGYGRSRKDPMYLMTRNGALFLITGYTGEKAGLIKEAYMNRFDAMEAFIRNYILAKDEFPIFTQATEDAYDEPKAYHYSNECNMIYHIVLGMDAKHFREIHNIPEGKSIRPFLTNEQANAIRKLQKEDIRLLYRGIDYQEHRKKIWLTGRIFTNQPFIQACTIII